MAKMTYGIYLDHEPHCYIISNADVEYAEYIAPETFTNPSIKMTILETETDDLKYVFDANEDFQNHPELVENLMQALRGELPGWTLTGVNVNAEGLYLIYRTEHEPAPDDDGELCGDGVVFPQGNFKLLFEVDHADGTPVEHYEVEHCKVPRGKIKGADCTSDMVSAVYITEYVGKRKRRYIELREDNHGQPFIRGKQYCLITEY